MHQLKSKPGGLYFLYFSFLFLFIYLFFASTVFPYFELVIAKFFVPDFNIILKIFGHDWKSRVDKALLHKMEQYREENKFPAYDEKKVSSLLRCIWNAHKHYNKFLDSMFPLHITTITSTAQSHRTPTLQTTIRKTNIF